MTSNVLLLREPSDENPDRYEAAFSNAGYHPISVPVLETVYFNIPTLSQIIDKEPDEKSYHGVIITSKRSCDAWREALKLIRDRILASNTSDVEGKERLGYWDHIPFYVVGEATASSLREVLSEFSDIGFGSVKVKGQDSGNAGNLASFILDDVKGKPQPKLLYLTGDKNRDTITRILAGSDIDLEPLLVYKTQGSSSFENALVRALDIFPKDSTHWWIIYFAPSAADFVTPILQKYFLLQQHHTSLSSIQEPSTFSLRPSRIAAIGPTTTSFLRDDLHLQVDALASKPTPDDIVLAVNKYDSNNQ